MLEDRSHSANARGAPGTSEEAVSLELAPSSARPDSKPLSAALERIGKHTPASARYRLEGEIARGGMGIIQRVWDGNLRRAVARKILGKTKEGSDPRKSDPRSVGRFLEEAQVTAQLEHPGIVPVHELGLDSEGKLYFTMRLVRGEDLHTIFEHVKAGAHGWNLTRALHVMLRVCEAMSYAHKKGVLHRDLKPANVMVGRFGEVYVMDWGLARVLGEHDTKDLRIAPDPASTEVRTDRASIDVDTPDSPLVTMDGDVVGTPAYMSPEQARGEVEALGPATDVYSLGAMLYHLLAGHMPYVEPGTKPSARAIWHRVMERPPVPLAPTVPAELVAIVDKAMARECAQRYESVLELADDLRAYLELRVVRAHRTGALTEFAKWVRRNRLSATTLMVLLFTLTLGGAGLAVLQRNRRLTEHRRNLEHRMESLVARATELWPIAPSRIPALEAWLEEARRAVLERDRILAELEAFEASNASAARAPAEETSEARAIRDRLRFREERLRLFEESLSLLEGGTPVSLTAEQVRNQLSHAEPDRLVLLREIPEVRREARWFRAETALECPWRYLSAELELMHSRVHRQVMMLDRLSRPGGLIDETQVKLESARELRQLNESQGQVWFDAAREISDPGTCPAYKGLNVAPQEGLLPLGRNARTGLHEFWHPASGERPSADASGEWTITSETSLVFVLIPSGTVWMGSQNVDPQQPNYWGSPDEPLPRHLDWLAQAELAPYFLSKYELTQGQWQRLGGSTASVYYAGFSNFGFPRLSAAHPADSMAWAEADTVLRRSGLVLPTQAQWEHAARAGSQGKYSCGSTPNCLAAQANFLDVAALRAGWPGESTALEDGFVLTSPVGALAPNPWGLHDMFGNVEEWCLDWYSTTCEPSDILPEAGEHEARAATEKTYRGGSFRSALVDLWVSARGRRSPDSSDVDLGVRPCRKVFP